VDLASRSAEGGFRHEAELELCSMLPFRPAG
jgi:hypothetical protein